jgi:glycosyltransferase involved in cell wall biosynthesis
MQKLSIILPIHNESPNIPILFAALQEVLHPYQYEMAQKMIHLTN